MAFASRRTLLVISQVYPPDPAAVGQQIHDAAAELVRRGWRVLIYCADRGYDDPSRKFRARETLDGVEVRRLPLSSFGKRSILTRVLGGLSLLLQATIRGLFLPKLDAILVSTSPPMASICAVIVGTVRQAPITYWVMDVNPDQMIELGKITHTSVAGRIFNAINRLILRRSARVVVLDHFMASRIIRKVNINSKLDIMPPWPQIDELQNIPHHDNPFRKQHNPENKFVIMYSGNHGFSTPITTVLEAALRLQDRTDILFMFIGGGIGKKEVDDAIAHHKPINILSLPYLPLDQIKYSLSAADVHLVSVGDKMVGVVHPCKIYGAMAIAKPILLLGPDPCHVSDLIQRHCIGWRIDHGDVERAMRTIEEIVATAPSRLNDMGRRAAEVVNTHFSRDYLLTRFCDVVEDMITSQTP